MRKLGIDYGDVRLGLALSDPMGIIAGALEVYTRKNTDADFEYIARIVREKEADTVVIGMPVNMDGTKGIRAEKSAAFGEKLKGYTNAKIDYIDERLSTVSAEKALIEVNMRREKRKGVIDKIAAQIFLQNYLDMPKRNN